MPPLNAQEAAVTMTDTLLTNAPAVGGDRGSLAALLDITGDTGVAGGDGTTRLSAIIS